MGVVLQIVVPILLVAVGVVGLGYLFGWGFKRGSR